LMPGGFAPVHNRFQIHFNQARSRSRRQHHGNA
jgi:hypothetical protein